jgi:surfeit locus 1 family protein
VIRTALQPRWLALLAVLLIVVYTFARLGLWQLAVAQDRAFEETLAAQAAQAEVPVEEVLKPFGAFPADASGRPVSATGRYDADLQFLVPDRLLEGRTGYWVMTPLRTEEDALLTVLRGWVASPDAADSPPATEVEVTGTLAPGESPSTRTDLSAGLLDSVDLAVLANQWEGDLYNAFVFATGEEPQVTATSVEPVPPPSLSDRGVDWGNLGYALQWWVFAGFAVYMYLRFLKEASAERHTVPS